MTTIPDELIDEYQNDPVVHATLTAWMRGHYPTLQDALVACVKKMAHRNDYLSEECVRLAERTPVQYVYNDPDLDISEIVKCTLGVQAPGKEK
jgi:hypothetical protein